MPPISFHPPACSHWLAPSAAGSSSMPALGLDPALAWMLALGPDAGIPQIVKRGRNIYREAEMNVRKRFSIQAENLHK